MTQLCYKTKKCLKREYDKTRLLQVGVHTQPLGFLLIVGFQHRLTRSGLPYRYLVGFIKTLILLDNIIISYNLNKKQTNVKYYISLRKKRMVYTILINLIYFAALSVSSKIH